MGEKREQFAPSLPFCAPLQISTHAFPMLKRKSEKRKEKKKVSIRLLGKYGPQRRQQ